jgi:hypothetical protein
VDEGEGGSLLTGAAHELIDRRCEILKAACTSLSVSIQRSAVDHVHATTAYVDGRVTVVAVMQPQ